MLALLRLYLKKTYKVFQLSLITTTGVGVLLGCLLLVPGVSYVLSCMLAATIASSVMHAMGFRHKLGVLFFILALMYMPALALSYSLAAVSIGMIPLFVVIFDEFAKRTLGKGFSLAKLLLNPRECLETLRPILEEQAISCVAYLNLINDATTPGSVGHCKPLEFTPEQEADFVARQTKAMSALPADLKILNADIEAREFTSTDLDIVIAQKTAAYQAYRKDLTPVQQTCFDTYLECTLNLSHAICSVSRELLTPENQHQFIILEKRYQNDSSWHAVPETQGTAIFYLDPDERDMFMSLASYQKPLDRWVISHPLNRDFLFTPSTYNGSVTQYRRYTYQKIAGHPLSLQVCEATEAFNLSMQVSPAADMTVAQQLHPAPTLSPSRPMPLPSTAPSNIDTLNIYTERQRREGSVLTDVDVLHENTNGRVSPSCR